MHSHRRDKDKEVTVNVIFVHGVIEHDEKNYDEGVQTAYKGKGRHVMNLIYKSVRVVSRGWIP
jgi:hypothetical protein